MHYPELGYISSLQHRYYSIHDLTAGLHAKLDLTLGNHKLEWYNMYVNTNSKGIRYNNSINTEYISSDTYTQDDETRSLSQTQSIFATHLKGTHHLMKDFTIDWSGLYSEATEKAPDRVYLTLTNTVQSEEVSSLWNGDKTIVKTQPKDMERRFQHNDDKDLAGYINLSYDTHFGDALDALWKAGAQYRRKERNNRYYSYIFGPSNISQRLDGNGFDQFAAIDWTCKTPYSEPTLKSKACLKCLYFTIIIFDLCRYLEYFSYLYTINQTE